MNHRLVGKLLTKCPSVDAFGGSYNYLLYNSFQKDGVIKVWTKVPPEYGFFKDVEPNITRLHHSSKKIGANIRSSNHDRLFHRKRR